MGCAAEKIAQVQEMGLQHGGAMERLIDAKLGYLHAALKGLGQNRPPLCRKSSLIVHIYSGFLLAADDFNTNAVSCPS